MKTTDYSEAFCSLAQRLRVRQQTGLHGLRFITPPAPTGFVLQPLFCLAVQSGWNDLLWARPVTRIEGTASTRPLESIIGIATGLMGLCWDCNFYAHISVSLFFSLPSNTVPDFAAPGFQKLEPALRPAYVNT
jgi:hypothetical protein